MQRILIFTKIYAKDFGGLPQSIYELARHFKNKKKFDVCTDNEFIENIASVNFNNLKISKKHSQFKAHNYEYIVIAGSWQLGIIWNLFKFKNAKVKIIYFPKGSLIYSEFYSYKFLYKLPALFFLESLKILLSDTVIFTSEIEFKNSFINRRKKKFIVADFFQHLSHKKSVAKIKKIINIGFIAKYSKRKNLAHCIDAIEMVIENLTYKDRDINFFIAGSACDYSYHKLILRKINMSRFRDHIILLGDINSYDKENFYKKMDIILYPSSIESFGLIPFEAIQFGCKFVTSNKIGSLENIKSEWIFKLNVINKFTISGAIEKLIDADNTGFSATINSFNDTIVRSNKLWDKIFIEGIKK